MYGYLVIVKKQLDQFCGVGIRSYFLCPAFLPLLKFVIGHIARYAPSSKFQNQQKYRSKLLNLFFHYYLVGVVIVKNVGGPAFSMQTYSFFLG